MDFCSYLSADAVRLGASAHSKKKVLETLAGMLAAHCDLHAQALLRQLLEREKLGSTGLGGGIAVPHCRVAGLSRPLACVLRTGSGVDYDAPDDEPVSLFFALLVPEDADDEHLQLLGDLARRLNDPERVKRLECAADADEIIAVLHKQPAEQTVGAGGESR